MQKNARTVGLVSCARFGALARKKALERHALSLFIDDGTDGEITPAIRAVRYGCARSVVERLFGDQNEQACVSLFEPAHHRVQDGTGYEDPAPCWKGVSELSERKCTFGAVSCARFAAVADTA
eukprot:IDg5602t1